MKDMKIRTLVTGTALALGATALLASPAYAKAPHAPTAPTASVAVSPSACTVSVTFTWKNYSGTADTAAVQLHTGTMIRRAFYSGLSGRSGNVTATFPLQSSAASNVFTGQGTLYNANTTLTTATSASVALSCA